MVLSIAENQTKRADLLMNNHPRTPKPKAAKQTNHTVLWIVVSALVGALSIAAVMSQARELSVRDILASAAGMHRGWLTAAVVCMLGFILSEACAIRRSCALLDVRCPARKTLSYSAADIYFSAITPSSTGGQPASACLMVSDGIPAMKSTAVLIMNLSLFTCSVVLISVVSIVTRPAIFLHFGILSRVLIVGGGVMQVLLVSFLLLLVRNEKLLSKICFGTISLLKKLHIVRHEERVRARFEHHMEQYQLCAVLFARRRRELWEVFFFEFLQRFCQVAVTVCVYMALGGGKLPAYDVWVLQSFILMGANYLPVPGGMGVTDYLMLDGFTSFMTADAAVNLELISRSVSFYSCILLCGATLLVRIVVQLCRRKMLEREVLE